MKPSDIQVGKTYANRGAGRTHRKVLAIGPDIIPDHWWGDEDKRPPAGTPGVRFVELNGHYRGRERNLYLQSFAAWAGEETA